MNVPAPVRPQPARVNPAEQRRWLERAAEAFVRAPDVERALACFVRLENWERAAECCEQLQQWPEAADYYARTDRREDQARCLERANRWEEAAETYLELDQVERAAWCWDQAGQLRRAGELYRQCGQFDRAATAFRRSGDMQAAAECLLEAQEFLEAGTILEEHLQDYAGALRAYERCEVREGTEPAIVLMLRRMRCLCELRRYAEERELRRELLTLLRSDEGWASAGEHIAGLRQAGKYFAYLPGAELPGRGRRQGAAAEEQSRWCRDDLAKEFYERADLLAAKALDRRERRALLEEYRSRFEHDRALWLELRDRIADLAGVRV